MKRTRNTGDKSTKLAPVTVTEDEKAEIKRRAAAAGMTVAEYQRRRALGEPCAPVLRRVSVRG